MRFSPKNYRIYSRIHREIFDENFLILRIHRSNICMEPKIAILANLFNLGCYNKF